jgi:purine-binding chemotaxis protein CheW
MTTQTATDPGPRGSNPAPDGAAASDMQLVVCVVGDERYGLEVGRVREIIRVPVITALPGADPSLSGVINLRGRVIPVMDLRRRLGLQPAEVTRLSRIVVADAGGSQVGFAVDAVEEVIRVAGTAIESTPVLTAGPGSEHLTGVARTDVGLIVLLDLDRLVGPDATTGQVG